MHRHSLLMIGAAMLFVAGCQTTPVTSLQLATGQQVVPPMGFIGFCLSDPAQCEGGTDMPARAQLTPARWTELNTVNDYVNSNVPQIEDIAHYGVSEKWSYPDATGGDCEDMAMLKRKLLIDRGWSPSNLLLAVVRDWSGEGHAVLVVTTEKADYVLDNLNPMILPVNEAPYTWVKRQSQLRPYIWVDLDPKTFRDIPAQPLPPLGAPVPFVVAAQAFAKELKK